MKAIFVALVLMLLASGVSAAEAEETTYNVPALVDDLIDEFDWQMIGMYNRLATPIDWILYI